MRPNSCTDPWEGSLVKPMKIKGNSEHSFCPSKFHPASQPEWRWVNASTTYYYSLTEKKRASDDRTGRAWRDTGAAAWQEGLSQRAGAAAKPPRRGWAARAQTCRILCVSICSSEGTRGSFFFFFLSPACKLKAAFPSEQALLCPCHLNPTHLILEPSLSGQQHWGIAQHSGRDNFAQTCKSGGLILPCEESQWRDSRKQNCAWACRPPELRLSYVLQTCLWGS